MFNFCMVCGRRIKSNVCECGFDITKAGDGYRTLSVIAKDMLSTYQKRKNYEKGTIAQNSVEINRTEAVKKEEVQTEVVHKNTTSSPYSIGKSTGVTTYKSKYKFLISEWKKRTPPFTATQLEGLIRSNNLDKQYGMTVDKLRKELYGDENVLQDSTPTGY